MSTYKTMPATDAKTPRGRRIVLAAAAVSFCLGAYVAQAASKTLRGSTKFAVADVVETDDPTEGPTSAPTPKPWCNSKCTLYDSSGASKVICGGICREECVSYTEVICDGISRVNCASYTEYCAGCENMCIANHEAHDWGIYYSPPSN